ncbi:MAG: hypothetical protein ACPGN3_06285 [Opitutales bacterium]
MAEILPRLIESDLTLRADREYYLTEIHYVLPGVSLTIEPGVRISTPENQHVWDPAVLVVTRGAQIWAEGTSDEPIVFDQISGIVILGDAFSKESDAVYPGIDYSENSLIQDDKYWGIMEQYPTFLDDPFLLEYGGDNPRGNSGVLKYVSIRNSRYMGLYFNDLCDCCNTFGYYLPLLSLMGVGAETVVDNIEIYKPEEEAMHVVGGSVDLTHIFVNKSSGEIGKQVSLRLEGGYTGNLQYALVAQSDPDWLASSTLETVPQNLSAITIVGLDEDSENPDGRSFLSNVSIYMDNRPDNRSIPLIDTSRSDSTFGGILNSSCVANSEVFLSLNLDDLIVFDQTYAGLVLYNYGRSEGFSFENLSIDESKHNDPSGLLDLISADASLNVVEDPGGRINSGHFSYLASGPLLDRDAVAIVPVESKLEQSEFVGAFGQENWADWTYSFETGDWLWTENTTFSVEEAAADALDTDPSRNLYGRGFRLADGEESDREDLLTLKSLDLGETDPAYLSIFVDGPREITFDYSLVGKGQSIGSCVTINNLDEVGFYSCSDLNFYYLLTEEVPLVATDEPLWNTFSYQIPEGDFEIRIEAELLDTGSPETTTLQLDRLIISDIDNASLVEDMLGFYEPISNIEASGLLDSNWGVVDWLGVIEISSFPWIYHTELRWLYAEEIKDEETEAENRAWLWIPCEGGWYLFSEAAQSYCWSSDHQEWQFIFSDETGSWIYSYKDAEWRLIE